MSLDAFGLQYEFVYRHGHYMELYKEEGLKSSELSALQLRMLEANQVPRLLPLEIHEVDARIRLQYQLSSRRMLSHVLKVESLTLRQFAKLMYAIVCTLMDSKNYMLTEANHILKDNFIFIGGDWSDIYLTYVPLQNQHEAQDISLLLDSLLRKISNHIIEAEQNQLPTWMVETSMPKSLQDIQTAFLRLMDETITEPRMAVAAPAIPIPQQNQPILNPPPAVQTKLLTNSANDEANTTIPSLPKAHLKRDIGKSKNSSALSQPRQVLHPLPDQNTEDPYSIYSQVSRQFIQLNPREKWFSIAILVLLTAYLWQLYASYSSADNLQIIAGCTLLLGDIGFIILSLGRPSFLRNGNGKNRSDTNDYAFSTPMPIVRPGHTAVAEEPTNMEDYYRNLPMHTTLLRPSKPNATVFLGKLQVQQLAVPRLIFQVDGETKSLLIQHELFTIGRGDANCKVDYVMEVAGVSRIHAEIMKTSKGYQLRDAGSTNGTYLNGEAMVNYQAYPLKDGDVIRIIRQEMTFREENK